MATNSDLNKLIVKEGYWDWDFYSLVPKHGKFKTYGNFEFYNESTNGCELYVRYIGPSKEYNFLLMPDPERSSSTRWFYSHNGQSKTFNNKKYCLLVRSWNSPSKNNTFSPTAIVNFLEEIKTNKLSLKTRSKTLVKDPDIKAFKKIIKQEKENWIKAKKTIVEEHLKISYDEYLADQNELQNSKGTQFILKIAPMLTRLRDECDLILRQLGEKNGPSKQARQDFTDAYKRFQGFHDNKTILTAIKNFDKKRNKK